MAQRRSQGEGVIGPSVAGRQERNWWEGLTVDGSADRRPIMSTVAEEPTESNEDVVFLEDYGWSLSSLEEDTNVMDFGSEANLEKRDLSIWASVLIPKRIRNQKLRVRTQAYRVPQADHLDA